MDHFAQIGGIGKPEEPTLEGYSTLSYLARMTQSAKLGTLVTGVIYRYPDILVKTVTALKPSLVALHGEAQERLRVLHRAVGL